ncbi:DNA topoisomerase 3-beta [Choristoneura fumiferana]|uniref:DNA topoisomerase 3-beta n=1 Tax=Choristoneura fumiferana TaxID=7141 RepID=UPI003D156E5B
MKTVLMVAEKPSLAQNLANILSNGKCNTNKGSNSACAVHEWNGTFKNEPVRYKMTSVCGHVMSLDFTGKYNNWDKVDPVELFSCTTEKKEAMPRLRIPAFLAQESRDCDYLVLWLDCDKEGENICFEVMSCVQAYMKGDVCSPQVTYRARFSAITEKDIKAAMLSLVRPNENESRSVDARQELDLRIGCAFTRFQTKYFQGRYGDLDATLISYGPCQTPTLGFCVQRHDEIQTFKPETYWVLRVTASTSEGRELPLEWKRVRSFDKDIANMFLSGIKEIKEAQVIAVQAKEKVKARPTALNTVELMRVASAGLGMSPHQAMQVAERLYTQGYISYPRTETTSYSENFDLMGTLRQQQSSSKWGAEVRALVANGINKPKKGHDAGDHPPITPMRAASESELEGDMWRIYDYVTRHFIATLSRDCKYLSTSITFKIGTETFTYTGNTLVDAGYTEVMHWQAFGKDEFVPLLAVDDMLRAHDHRLVECQTSPPDYLTESEVITLMEKHGIGTDASIPVHINNICQRNYVTVGSGRRLVPTNLGIVLVHGYQKIDPELVLPTMRSAVEEQLNLIAIGRADYEAVLSHTTEIFRRKFQYFVRSIEGMDQLFEVNFSSLKASGKALSRCGKCRRYMRYIQAKPTRLHCSHCDDTYGLPQNGTVRIYRELKCPLDDFELLSWSTGTKGKSFPLCPYCYNHPPFRDMKKGFGCNSCTHPTCSYGVNSTGVSGCVECEAGVLVLDPAAPKWKLACNRCDVIINVFDDAIRVSVCEQQCAACGAQLVTAEYRPERTPLPAALTEMTGCLYCEPAFSAQVATRLLRAGGVRQQCAACGAQLVTAEYRPERTPLPAALTEMTGCLYCEPAFSAQLEKHRAVAARAPASRGRGGRSRGNKHRNKQPKDKMAQLAAYFV